MLEYAPFVRTRNLHICALCGGLYPREPIVEAVGEGYMKGGG